MANSVKTLAPKYLRDRYRSAYRELKKIKTEAIIVGGKARRIFFPVPFPNLESGKVNLHLGCGPINHPKFINVDGLPAPHVHYIRPIDDLSCFKEESVDLIYASHCLEHFSHRQLHEVLTEWFRVLKKGGTLRLSVPDFDLLLDVYKDSGNDVYSIIYALMGNQDYKYNFHMIIFNKASLSSSLKEAGFSKIDEWQTGSCELTTFNDYSIFGYEINGKKYPINLNIQAIKE